MSYVQVKFNWDRMTKEQKIAWRKFCEEQKIDCIVRRVGILWAWKLYKMEDGVVEGF